MHAAVHGRDGGEINDLQRTPGQGSNVCSRQSLREGDRMQRFKSFELDMDHVDPLLAAAAAEHRCYTQCPHPRRGARPSHLDVAGEVGALDDLPGALRVDADDAALAQVQNIACVLQLVFMGDGDDVVALLAHVLAELDPLPAHSSSHRQVPSKACRMPISVVMI